MLALLVSIAHADPLTVLALGGGVVATSTPNGSAAPTLPGGWVPMLADCLEERAPRRFTVLDRTNPGEALGSTRERAVGTRALTPAVVVVAVGARELSGEGPGAHRDTLAELMETIRPKGASGPHVLLISPVPDGSGPDTKVVAFARTLAELAHANPDATVVDVLANWPKDGPARDVLTQSGRLTDQGHARVAAAVCEAVLAKAPK